METNDKKDWKKLKVDPKTEEASQSTDTQAGAGENRDENQPPGEHSSQGHATDAKGTATSTREPTLRTATTDSSRAPKNNNDEGPTGGNVR